MKAAICGSTDASSIARRRWSAPGRWSVSPKHDEVVVVRVEGLPDRRGPFVEACRMYTDLTQARMPEPAH